MFVIRVNSCNSWIKNKTSFVVTTQQQKNKGTKATKQRNNNIY